MPDVDLTVQYRDIPGFPGYRVGDDGSVWSCWGKRSLGIGKGTAGFISAIWHRLNPGLHEFGYHVVTLCCNAKRHCRTVHSLVLESFVGPAPRGMQCRHFPDRNPANNRLTNLRYGTPRENAEDKIAQGTYTCGQQHCNAVLTDEEVNAIRKEHKEGKRQHQIASDRGISRPMICLIVNRKTWKHLK